MTSFFDQFKGVFHLLHTAFEVYVFLVVENQKMLEMDKRLNNSLEIQMKKGKYNLKIDFEN